MKLTSGKLTSLGQIMQLAYVPADLDAAVAHWTRTVGAGPFFHIPNVQDHLLSARYRGVEADIRFSVTLGYWGDMQIEFIRQDNDTPSIYTEWRAAGLEGLHHVCILVDDMAHARKVVAQSGAEIVQEIFLEGGEAIYVDTGGGPGTMIEMYQAPPGRDQGYAAMREAARDWDGSDPFRMMG